MASETTWKTGDTVQLKSGGPVMTVHGDVPGSKASIHCIWFAGEEKKSNDNFHPDTLMAATGPAQRK